eukprot:64554-Pleurochrysis_carterae.AAC.1
MPAAMAAAKKKALAAKETNGQERVAALEVAVAGACSFPPQGIGASLSGTAATMGGDGEGDGEGDGKGRVRRRADPSVSDSACEGSSDEVRSSG